jgi:hypothetical protein
MSLPAEAAATVLSEEAVAAWLLEFAFESETTRVWLGFGKLKTLDGREWEGKGELISIGTLEPCFSVSASPGTVTASGVSPVMMAKALAASEYRDRPLIIYLQPFQGRTLYGNPVPLASRFMKQLGFTRDEATLQIALEHEGPFTGRRRPAAGSYSDADQRKRHPGDRFCERTPYYRFARSQWPHYV